MAAQVSSLRDLSGLTGPASLRLRVVVADDAASLRQLLCTLLEAEDDFEVVGEACDGAQAVRLAVEHRPDLVLLDLAMPVMDGLEALHELRRVLPSTRVVIFSGFESATVAAEAAKGGADDYIEKGVGVPELLDRLRMVGRRSDHLRPI